MALRSFGTSWSLGKRARAALVVLCALAASAQTHPLSAQQRTEPVMLPAGEHQHWQAIGRLNKAGYNNKRMCSATLVSPDTVLTAAHCISGAPDYPKTVDGLHFVAGWFRGTFAAHAQVVAVSPYPAAAPVPGGAWQKVARDAVLLTLETPIETVPSLPMTAPDGSAELRILGYRWDRPHALSDSGTCPQLASPPGTMLMTCPVTFGTSGAPVLQKQADGWRVVGTVSAMSPNATAAIPVPAEWQGLSQGR